MLLNHKSAEAYTYCDWLEHVSNLLPNKNAVTFLLEGQEVAGRLTYSQLIEKAQKLAGILQQQMNAGDRALLLYPTGIDFVLAFIACLYAGVIAVPANISRQQSSIDQLNNIINDCQPKIILSNAFTEKFLTQLNPNKEIVELGCCFTDKMHLGEQCLYKPVNIVASTIAFLQYTSGSTNTPKGVVIKHENIMRNNRMIQDLFSHTQEDVFINWLPLFHDMGLVGNLIQPLFLGAEVYLMSPNVFLRKPAKWLNAIAKYKGTVAGGPNFAYDLCVRSIDCTTIPMLDLSNWRVAFNGAEPIQSNTLTLFFEKFEPYGFKRSSFMPCYGMSETTLITSGISFREESLLPIIKTSLETGKIDISESPSNDDVITLVSSGNIFDNQQADWAATTEIKIIDTKSLKLCETLNIGEIWIRGQHVACEYWNNEKQSTETFHAKIPGIAKDYFRTGDLGFIDNQGMLFVTGRLKDLIIINGRNYYPSDIEQVVENTDNRVRKHSVIAFSVDNKSSEKVIIVLEIERTARHSIDYQQLGQMIHKKVLINFDIPIASIIFIRQNSLPKTSSGKVQRNKCRKQYLLSELNIVEQYIPVGSGASSSELSKLQNILIYNLSMMKDLDISKINIDLPIQEFDINDELFKSLVEGIQFKRPTQVDLTCIFKPDSSISQHAKELVQLT